MDVDINSLNLKEIEAFASESEQQWHSAATLQIKALQKALAVKDELYKDVCCKFDQLKEDFKYNLKLLHERDTELKNLDCIQKYIKINESKYLSDLSDLHVKNDNMLVKLKHEEQTKKEMELHYKQVISDRQTQFEIFRTAKSKEMEELTSEFQKSKFQLEQENNQLKFKIEAQKLDLVNEMETLLKVQEKEQNEKEEKNHKSLVFLEMKIKLLSKENDILHRKETDYQSGIDSANRKIEHLQCELQQTKWEMSDLSSLKNSRILELESKVKHLESLHESLEKDFAERKQQLDKEIHRKESNLISAKQTMQDREKRFIDEIRSLEIKIETSQVEVNRALWDKNNLKSELEEKLEKLQAESSELREKLEEKIIEQSKLFVAKDADLALSKKRDDLLKFENSKLKKDIEILKKDLSKSIKREESFAKQMEQLKIDMKHKYDDAESRAYVKNHNFAEDIVRSRDSAVAEKDRLNDEVRRIKEINDTISNQLSNTCSFLEKHNLLEEYQTTVHSPSIQINLNEQNKQLKLVVKQMTSDMEELRKQQQFSTKFPSQFIDNKYVESLEQEVLDLKKENRRLNEELESLRGSAVQDKTEKKQPDLIEISSNHPKIQEHIQTLTHNISRLEAEKLDMRAQVQKLQAKFDHQLMIAQQHEQDSRSLVNKLQQFELESTACKHRSEQEIKRLKNEITNLSSQLFESRREADEYYRGGIQTNMRAMELSEKVSKLTVDMAAQTPWLTNRVHAKLVQDLQDKVSELQKQLAYEKQYKILNEADSADAGNTEIKLLRLELNAANEQIKALRKEKKMILESSNKMRAELNALQEQHHDEEIQSSNDNARVDEGNLDIMEKLQYDLTKKQLAFAQRYISTKTESSSLSASSEAPTKLLSKLKNQAVANPRGSTKLLMSSVDDASIKDVWKVLENEPSSPSIVAEPVVLVHAPKKTSSSKVPTSKLPKKKKTKPKIRNYNVKDDRT